MDTLSQDQLKLVAGLVADRNLTEAERESRALSIAGSRELARRALDWLPEAFGLVAVSRMDALDLPTTFSAKSLDGTWHEFPLSAEPLYAQAVSLALDPSVSFRGIAEQGSCIDVVDKALNAGASLQGAKLSGPTLIGVPAEAYFPAVGRYEINNIGNIGDGGS